MRTKFKTLMIASLSLALFTACETDEQRAVAAGQSCLDGAKTSAQADACLDPLAGIETKEAYLVRCQINFVVQGFTGARLAEAFQRMKDDSTSGNDPFVQLTTQLVFSETAYPRSTVAETVSNCAKSEVSSLRRLADGANFATTLVTLGGLNPATFNPADPAAVNDVKSAITNLATSNDPNKEATIGNLAVSMNASFCNEGSSFSDKEVCTYIAQAQGQATADGDSSAAGLGAKLLDLLHAK